jgi:hypothetical protein
MPAVSIVIFEKEMLRWSVKEKQCFFQCHVITKFSFYFILKTIFFGVSCIFAWL